MKRLVAGAALLAAAMSLPFCVRAEPSPAPPAASGPTESSAAAASAPLDAAEVVRRVNARAGGHSVFQRLEMTMSDASGGERRRTLDVYRRSREGETDTVLFFTAPASVRDTALLVRDYADGDRADGLWLYLPAMRTVRRVSTGGRGEKFFGSEFSLLEVSTDTRLRDDLLSFETIGREPDSDRSCVVLKATPLAAALAEEVGYAAAEYWIDDALWIPRRVRLRAEDGSVVKEIRFEDLREAAGVVTVHRRRAVDLASGKATTLDTVRVVYDVDLPDALFKESGLARGAPAAPE